MKKVSILSILLFHLITTIAFSQTTYIKVSVNDCITCTSAIEEFKNKKNIVFLLNSAYKSDSAEIIEKFNLYAFNDVLVWDEKLYNSLSKNDFSEVIKTSKNGEVESRHLLKTFSSKKDNEPDLAICQNDFPVNFNFWDYKNYIYIHNYIADKKFIFDKRSKQLNLLSVDWSWFKKIYLNLHKDSNVFNYYYKLQSNQPNLKPKITAVYIENDSVLNMCVMTYKVKSVTGLDTILGKELTILKMENNKIIDYALIDSKAIPNGVSINENSFFMDDNKNFYFALLKNHSDSNTHFPFLVRFEKNARSLNLISLSNFELNKELIENKIFYNFGIPVFSNNYFTSPVLNYVGSINDNSKIKIPIENEIFKANKIDMVNGKYSIKYMLLDFKVNKSTNEMCFFYMIEKDKFVSILKIGEQNFKKTFKINSDKLTEEKIKAIKLRFDGLQLIYHDRVDNCLKYFDYHNN